MEGLDKNYVMPATFATGGGLAGARPAQSLKNPLAESIKLEGALEAELSKQKNETSWKVETGLLRQCLSCQKVR
jgi:hypothetical protein